MVSSFCGLPVCTPDFLEHPMRVCPKCSEEMPDAICPADGAHTMPVAASSRQTYPLGTLIADRYRIDAVLGIGGFGAVYRCTQLNMNQVVAVKVLRADHLSSLEHVKRFSGEAQAVSRLRHPNTIRVFDFGTHADGALYLAMEYIEGETLGHRFDTKGALPWPQLVRILTQVCHSLTEAHAAGLIHRDLKPENVMLLSVAGDADFVKVLDFGIAKQQKEAGEGNLTETGMIMGTPTYMSPEQAKGEPIDDRSDVYALGVLAFEALVGQPPFTGDTPMTVLIKHIKDLPPPFIREGALREVPRELEALVLQCLAKDPRQRPQTTAELAKKLVRIAETARRPSPRTSTSASTTSGWRRRELPVLAVHERHLQRADQRVDQWGCADAWEHECGKQHGGGGLGVHVGGGQLERFGEYLAWDEHGDCECCDLRICAGDDVGEQSGDQQLILVPGTVPTVGLRRIWR